MGSCSHMQRTDRKGNVMLQNKFFAIFVSCLGLLFASVNIAIAADETCDWCTPHKGARAADPVPYKKPLSCIEIEQEERGPVTLFLFEANGKLARPAISLIKNANDTICLDSDWFKLAGRYVVICNDYDSRETRSMHMRELAKDHGKTRVILVRDPNWLDRLRQIW